MQQIFASLYSSILWFLKLVFSQDQSKLLFPANQTGFCPKCGLSTTNHSFLQSFLNCVGCFSVAHTFLASSKKYFFVLSWLLPKYTQNLQTFNSGSLFLKEYIESKMVLFSYLLQKLILTLLICVTLTPTQFAVVVFWLITLN